MSKKRELKVVLLRGKIIEQVSIDLKTPLYETTYRDKDKVFSMRSASKDKSKIPEKRILLIRELKDE